MCYYLLIVEEDMLFDVFEVIVWLVDDGYVMGLCY